MSREKEMIFCVAPNGARLGKSDHDALPIEADELVQCAKDCLEAGAAMIHLHVRDHEGKHILDVAGYQKAIAAIRSELGDEIVIQVTTEAVGQYNNSEQMALVRSLKPEAVSLALRELVPDEAAVPAFKEFWQWMVSERIWPQIILYSASDVERCLALRNDGVFGDEKLSLLFVLGRYGQQVAEPKELLDFLRVIEGHDGIEWSACAFGPHENACITTAACLDGHARIGFENNRFMADGTVAKDNASLVNQAVKAASLVGRVPMNARKIRERYGVLN